MWRRKPTVDAGGPVLSVRALAECIGCMMFHFIGSVATSYGPTANGVVLMVIVYYIAKVSGAHLNPAVTLTFSILGHSHPYEVLVYWFAQLTGCVLGALWIAALVPGSHVRGVDDGFDGCFRPDSRISKMQIVGWEGVGTFCFLVPIFSVVWYTQNKSGYGNTGPLIVGLSLMATAMAVGPWTGAALNPARVLASPMVYDCGNAEYLGFYVAGEFLGAALVPFATLPWYGISAHPWYAKVIPKRVVDAMHYIVVGGGGGAPSTPESDRYTTPPQDHNTQVPESMLAFSNEVPHYRSVSVLNPLPVFDTPPNMCNPLSISHSDSRVTDSRVPFSMPSPRMSIDVSNRGGGSVGGAAVTSGERIYKCIDVVSAVRLAKSRMETSQPGTPK